MPVLKSPSKLLVRLLLASTTLAGAAVVVGPLGMPTVALAREEPTPTLKVGDPAPAFSPGKWIKGGPVAKLEKGTVYVIDFWATWCGPCVAAMPHLSKVAAQYRDKGVVVIAQNVWERDDSKVAPFVEKMGDKMAVNVALDDKTADPQGVMSTTWMRAAGQNGIPTTMIVDKEGTLAWIGHPSAMDEPLAQIVAGAFDAKKAAETRAKQDKLIERLQAEMAANNPEGAVAALDQAVMEDPALASQAALIKFSILIQTGSEVKAYAMVDDVLKHVDDAQTLNQIAWALLTDDSIKTKDPAVADQLATKAVELSHRKDAAILDTLARAKFDQGKKDEAITIQKEAWEKAPADERAEFEATLRKYQE